MKILISLIFFYSSLGLAAPQIGKPAPAFNLPAHDGKTYNLESLKGKWVVLEWFNNECPYVEKHYHEDFRNMQKLQAKWIKEGKKHGGLVWLAVNSSAPGKQGHLNAKKAKLIRDKERQAQMTAILLDGNGKVGRLYQAKTTPHMYIINPKGVLVYNGAIDDQPSARTSTIKGSKNYVSEALTALFSGQAYAQATTKPYGCSVKY